VIAIAILICEVGFWVLLLGGLATRYALRRPRLGGAMLLGVPLVDAVLLVVTGADLARGTEADGTHGLAAVYLGFSVAFGPTLVRDADRRFARRYGAAVPAPRPQRDKLAHELRLWARALLASAIAAGALGALILVAGDPEQTRALWEGGGWFVQLAVISVIWFLAGPVWAAAGRASPAARRPGAGGGGA
jgi:hypothetical protein